MAWRFSLALWVFGYVSERVKVQTKGVVLPFYRWVALQPRYRLFALAAGSFLGPDFKGSRPQSLLSSRSWPHLALWGQDNVIVRSCDGIGELAEDNRLLGNRGILLQAVVSVVHTHTHHLLWGQNRSQQPDVWSLQHTLPGRQGPTEAQTPVRRRCVTTENKPSFQIPLCTL